MKWQQKHNALVKAFGHATLSYDQGKFNAQLDGGWVFNSAGINRETGQGRTATQAINNLFEKMAHPAPGNEPGIMDGRLCRTKWNSHKREFVPA